MMYVELMKNFLLADSSKLMLLDSFRPPEPQKFESYFLLRVHEKCSTLIAVMRIFHEFMKFSLLPDSSNLMAVSSFRPVNPTFSPKTFRRVPPREPWLLHKTFESCFLDMMYVEFMKNFLLAHWSKLMAVRLISAS